jgi:predicted GIY-YIG superfamily endonuclease
MKPKYKRMLTAMVTKVKKTRVRLKKTWSIYILRCKDGSLYTGATNNIERRIGMHNKGTGARYTRSRGPVLLVYHENGMTRPQALVRECAVKSLTKQKKEELVLKGKTK